MPRLEIEDLAGAAVETAAAAEYITARKPADEDQLIGRWNIKVFAVHFLMRNFEILGQPSDDGMPRVNHPQAFFLAGSFLMQDKDILYVANAPGAEFRKFVTTILSPVLGTARATNTLGE